jgi:hypothetical protein
MMKPPPSERHQNGYTEQQMKDMLPSPDLAEQFIDVVTALAGDDSPPKVRMQAATCFVCCLAYEANHRVTSRKIGQYIIMYLQ